MLELVFWTDYRVTCLQEATFRLLYLKWFFWVFFYRCWGGVKVHQGFLRFFFTMLVSPKCHKVGQRSFGKSRFYLVLKIFGLGFYTKDYWAWMWCLGSSSFVLRRVVWRGSGAMKLVGLGGVQYPAFGSFSIKYLLC